MFISLNRKHRLKSLAFSHVHKNLQKKPHIKTVLSMSTSSVCSALVVCLRKLDRRLNCLVDLMTVQLRSSLQKPIEGGRRRGGGLPKGFPVDGSQQNIGP